MQRPVIARALIFALAYLASAELGHFLSFHPSRFATFWPASGVFLVALLRTPTAGWPLMLAASFAANLASDLGFHGKPFLVSLGFWTGNALEAIAGAALLRRLFGPDPTLRRWEQVGAILLLVGGFCSMLSATIGTGVIHAAFGTPSLWQTWQTWWASDVVGIAAVAPLLLVPVHREQPFRVGQWPLLELIIFTVSVIALAWCVFTWPVEQGFAVLGLPYFLFPLVVWMGLACGPRGATIGIVITLLLAVWGTTRGLGPFARLSDTPATLCLLIQGYVITLILVALPLSVLADSSRLLEQTLREKIDTLAKTRAAASADHALMEVLLDQSAGAVLAVDCQGRLILCNATARELLEISPGGTFSAEWARLLGLWAPDGTPPPSSSSAPLWAALCGQTIEGLTLPHPSRPGSLLVHAHPINAAGGAIGGAVLVAEAISPAAPASLGLV